MGGVSVGDVGILCTTWKEHLPTLPKCLELLSRYYDVVVGYDGLEFPLLGEVDGVQSFVSGKKKPMGRQKGETLLCKKGIEILHSMKKPYFIKFSGDHIVRRPEGIIKLFEKLNEYDIGSVRGTKPVNCKGFSTRIFFGWTESFLRIVSNAKGSPINVAYMNSLKKCGMKFLDMNAKNFDSKRVGLEYLDWWYDYLGREIGLCQIEFKDGKRKSNDSIFRLSNTYDKGEWENLKLELDNENITRSDENYKNGMPREEQACITNEIERRLDLLENRFNNFEERLNSKFQFVVNSGKLVGKLKT